MDVDVDAAAAEPSTPFKPAETLNLPSREMVRSRLLSREGVSWDGADLRWFCTTFATCSAPPNSEDLSGEGRRGIPTRNVERCASQQENSGWRERMSQAIRIDCWVHAARVCAQLESRFSEISGRRGGS